MGLGSVGHKHRFAGRAYPMRNETTGETQTNPHVLFAPCALIAPVVLGEFPGVNEFVDVSYQLFAGHQL